MMKFKEKPRIIETRCINAIGMADPYSNTIILHKVLNKFPELKKLILKHEIQHLKDNSFLKAFILDMKDYPVLYQRDDSQQCFKEIRKPYSFYLYQYLYNLAIGITSPFIILYVKIKRWGKQ